MRTRTTAAIGLATAGLLALTACSSNSGARATDPASTPSTTTAAPTKADHIHACTKAIIAALDQAMPSACNSLTTDDYFTALQAANQAGRDKIGADSCKAAIRAQYEPGTAVLTGAPTTPPECAGLSDDELTAIVTEVITENTGG